MAETNPQHTCSGPGTIVPGTLRLYRTWTYECLPPTRPKWWQPKRHNAVLAGHWSQVWDSTTMVATCMRRTDYTGPKLEYTHGYTVVPAMSCCCGIYGYYDRYSLSDLTVKGTIRASGKILMGTHGARVAKATIESLCVASTGIQYPEVYASMAKALKRAYPGVPVYTSMMEWVLDYPSEDVSELLRA